MFFHVLNRVVSQPECDGDAKSENGSPNFTEIIVIRHGETEWNADGKIQVISAVILLLKVCAFFFLDLHLFKGF